MTSSARHPRRLWVPCLLAGLALIAAAVAVLMTRDPVARAKAVPIVNVGTVPSSSAQVSHAQTHPVGGHAVERGSHLVLTRLHINAPIDDVALDGRVMQVPQDPRRVGWWTGGAKPGSDHGSVVIVGHINYAGTPGALGVLPSARPGDAVSLVEPGHTERYRIVAVHSYAKTSGLPSNAFRTSGSAQLVLITCGGSFDASTGNYRDNIVAYAEPF